MDGYLACPDASTESAADLAELEKLRALIFAGAGASFAVNSDAYPMTRQFFERLPSKIRGNPFVERILANLSLKFGEGPPDVEKVLWCLAELNDFFSAPFEQSNPASWLVPGGHLSAVTKSNQRTDDFLSLATTARQKISELQSEVTSRVYDFYSKKPLFDNLQENWQLLLNLLASNGYRFDVFTTNYDLVVEHACIEAGQPIEYGKGRGVVSILDLDIWKKALVGESSQPDKSGLLTKLHGSVNWVRDGSNIVFGGTSYLGNHSHHVVIYPGFKGVPRDEPFVLFHAYLEEAIRRADLIVAIGFAFRDGYINDCFERNLGSKVVHVIDPGALETTLLSGRVRHIQFGFGREAVDELRGHIS